MELFRLLGRISIENDEANQNIDETTDRAEKSENRMSSAFKKIGAAVATAFAVEKIVNFGKEVVNAAAEVSAETSAFEQIMGDYTDTATEKMNAVADSVGAVSTRMTPYMTSMTAKFKGLGFDIDSATTLASDGLTIAADAAAFWDKSLDDSMGSLNSFINGSYEGGEAIGLFANDTQMAQYAIQQGLVESTSAWSSLDEATKQATRLEYAKNMMALSGATGQAAKESDQYANVQANLEEKTRQFKAEIGEPLLENVVIPAMDKLSAAVDKARVAFDFLKEHSNTIKPILIAIATVVGIVTTALTIQSAVQAVKTAMNAAEVTSLGALIAAKLADAAATMAALAPYLLIAAAIAAVIAVVVLLIKNWDKVKEVAASVWEKIKEIWSKVSEWFKTTVIDPIMSFFTGLWESITGFFTNVWNKIVEVFTTIMTWIKTNIAEPIANFYDTWIAPVVNKIIEIVTKLVEIVVALFVGLFNLLKEKVIDPITNKFKELWEKVSGFFKSLWDDIVLIWQAVSAWFDAKVIQPIKNFFLKLWTDLKNAASAAWEGIKKPFAAVGTFFKDTFTKAYNAVTGVFSKITGFFSSVWEKIKNTFSKLGTSISDAIGGAVKSGINGVISMIEKRINSAINLINGAINLINKLPGVNVSKISTLSMPRLAKGNVAYEETPAIFGEYPGASRNPEITSPQSIMADTFRGVLDERKTNVINDTAITKKIDELIELIKSLKIYLDSGILVGEIAPDMDSAFGNINRMKVRGQ